ncbi:efflux RND transporter periplasmic adaptor subunit [Pirellulaceae bacterium SH449]
MNKAFVVSGAIAVAAFAGLSAVPQVRQFVHSMAPSLGIEVGSRTAATSPVADLRLTDKSRFADVNAQPSESEFVGKLVEIDAIAPDQSASTSHAQANAIGSDPMIRLAQSTEAAAPRTVNAIQTSPKRTPTTRLSSFEQLPGDGVAVPSAASSRYLVDENAALIFVNDVTVPAQADGIITSLLVDDGSLVKKGDLIYQLDPRLANAEISVQEKELEQARIKYEDDSSLEFSKLAYEVAKKEFQISNDLVSKNAEDAMANERKRLEADKARLQIKVSEMDKVKDAALVGVSEAKLDAAKVQLEMRRFEAPWEGMVSEVKKRQSAYVRAGEPILNLTDMRKVRVNGAVKLTDDVPPHAILNAPARITINIAPGVLETVDGIVGYVAPNSRTPNNYPFWIEIDNRLLRDGQYLFRGGMRAKVEIQPVAYQN